MSDSIQYKAIQSVLDQLVKAVTLEIESIFPKVWNSIIDKRKQNLSIGPDSSHSRKAEALVSAVAAEVAKDITVFDKFLAILRDYQKLTSIVKLLEAKVQNRVASMSKETSNSLSTGASSLPGSPRTTQPLDDVPKLALAEHLTKESGFGGEMTNPSPIAPEPQAAAIPGLTDGATVHIPRPAISKQTLQVLQNARDDSSYSQSASGSASNSNSSESCNNDENFPVVVLKDNSTTIPVSEASSIGTSRQEELVLPSSQDDLSLRETERKSEAERNAQLKKELEESRLSETQLKEKIKKLVAEIDKLRKENADLEKKLLEKVTEAKQTEDELVLHIAKLESKLKSKEVEVENIKKRLADVEKQNEAEIKQLRENIKKQSKNLREIEEHKKNLKTLEEENKILKSTVDQLHHDQKKVELENREKILTLKEELNKKKNEEAERTKELAAAQIEIANQKTEIANQKTQLVEQKMEMEKNLQRGKYKSSKKE